MRNDGFISSCFKMVLVLWIFFAVTVKRFLLVSMKFGIMNRYEIGPTKSYRESYKDFFKFDASLKMVAVLWIFFSQIEFQTSFTDYHEIWNYWTFVQMRRRIWEDSFISFRLKMAAVWWFSIEITIKRLGQLVCNLKSTSLVQRRWCRAKYVYFLNDTSTFLVSAPSNTTTRSGTDDLQGSQRPDWWFFFKDINLSLQVSCRLSRYDIITSRWCYIMLCIT